MARSKLQQMMEKDVEGMRERAESCREEANRMNADALSLEGQIDNYETLISRAGSFEVEDEAEVSEEAEVSAFQVEKQAQLDEEEGF